MRIDIFPLFVLLFLVNLKDNKKALPLKSYAIMLLFNSMILFFGAIFVSMLLFFFPFFIDSFFKMDI